MLGRTVRLLKDCTVEGAFHCLKPYSSCFQHKTCRKDLPAKQSLVFGKRLLELEVPRSGLPVACGRHWPPLDNLERILIFQCALTSGASDCLVLLSCLVGIGGWCDWCMKSGV